MQKIRFTKPCNKDILLQEVRKALPYLRIDYKSNFKDKEIGEKFLLVQGEGLEKINKIIRSHNIVNIGGETMEEREAINKGVLEKVAKPIETKPPENEATIRKPVDEKPTPTKGNKVNVLDPPKSVSVPIPSAATFLSDLKDYIKFDLFEMLNENFQKMDERHAENDAKRARSIGKVLETVSREREQLEETRDSLITSVSLVEGRIADLNAKLEETTSKYRETLDKIDMLDKKLSGVKIVFGP